MATIGIITSVITDSAEKQIYVNVVTGPNREPRRVPFVTGKPGMWVVPVEGQAVEVDTVDGSPVARFPHSRPVYDMPADLSEGDFCLRFNNGTEIRFAKQGDDTYNLDITADGDVSISATGNVYIDGIDFDAHTHDYVDSTDTGSSTKTTDPPA